MTSTLQRKHRILAVDDNPVNLAVLRGLLADYTLQTAASGEEGLRIASAFKPDAVLLDIMLPGIDGYETCRQIRSDPTLRHTKILMVSAKSELDERLAGYEVGADDYIVKPFDDAELLAKVRVYLKLKSVEEIEEVKNRVIEVLQHSSRTPLTSIISYAELLTCTDELENDIRVESAEAIMRNASRLHRLLEKGETLASMKSDQYAFVFAQCDLCDLARRVLDEVRATARERGVVIDTNLPETADLSCDREQMRFAIRELLDNAIEHSASGGVVTFQISVRDRRFVLTVSDRGAGIPQELMPRVFEPFGNPESPLHNQGDGLSLAIVQQIAWAHTGDLRVDSEPGSGTTFTMGMPTDGRNACQREAATERPLLTADLADAVEA